jgi:lipoate-protein ligase A
LTPRAPIGAFDRPDCRALQLLVTPGTDPRTNLALEDELLAQVEAGYRAETLRLWVNDACLIQGPHRTHRSGWHRAERAADLGIPIYTRSTGGGTVYHDCGNLNWSFYLRRTAQYFGGAGLFRSCAGLIIETLRCLGIEAEFAAPNRIDADGRKVSGISARASLEAVLVHGTLLVASDIDRLNALCIYPPGCPPAANLCALRPGLSVGDVVRAFERRMPAMRPPGPAPVVSPAPAAQLPGIP